MGVAARVKKRKTERCGGGCNVSGREYHIRTSAKYVTRVAYIWRLEGEVRRKLELEAKCSAFVRTIGLGWIDDTVSQANI